MKASEMIPGKWYTWGQRVVARLPGVAEVVEGQLAVPIKPIDVSLRERGSFLPVDEEVEEYRLGFIRVA